MQTNHQTQFYPAEPSSLMRGCSLVRDEHHGGRGEEGAVGERSSVSTAYEGFVAGDVVLMHNHRAGNVMSCLLCGIDCSGSLRTCYYYTLHSKLVTPALVPGDRLCCCKTGDPPVFASPPPIPSPTDDQRQTGQPER